MQHIAGWWIPSTVTERRHPVASRKKGSAIIDHALTYDNRRRVVVQAGGHLGLWPSRLSQYYGQVLTFEPDPENWECLRRNVAGLHNVHVTHGTLGERTGTASLGRKHQSTGGHYVKPAPSGSVPMFTLDSLGLPCLDALFLDVEGYEMAVLQGAAATIARTEPLLVCEENTAGQRYGHTPGDLARYLSQWGYTEVHRFKRDIVFAPPRRT